MGRRLSKRLSAHDAARWLFDSGFAHKPDFACVQDGGTPNGWRAVFRSTPMPEAVCHVGLHLSLDPPIEDLVVVRYGYEGGVPTTIEGAPLPVFFTASRSPVAKGVMPSRVWTVEIGTLIRPRGVLKIRAVWLTGDPHERR